VDAKGLQGSKRRWDTFIKEQSVSGWQVLQLQMATTDAWPPSALLQCHPPWLLLEAHQLQHDRSAFEQRFKKPTVTHSFVPQAAHKKRFAARDAPVHQPH